MSIDYHPPEITGWTASHHDLTIFVDGRYDFHRTQIGPDWVWVFGIRYIPPHELTRLVLAHPYLKHLAPLYELVPDERFVEVTPPAHSP